jgi:hypothetical protein
MPQVLSIYLVVVGDSALLLVGRFVGGVTLLLVVGPAFLFVLRLVGSLVDGVALLLVSVVAL